MSGIYYNGLSGGGGSGIQTVTGNSGGAVPPDGSNNLNLVGSGSVSVVGNTGTNTLTISVAGSSTSTTYTTANPYTVLTSDYVILVDTVAIGAPSTVLLIEAPVVDGQEWTIKDATGAAGTGNTITVQSVAADINIDAATTFVMNSAFESITVVWSSSQGQYYLI